LKKNLTKRGWIILFLVVSLISGLTQNRLYARDNRNVILVLDTSMSMIGYGGKDILGRVKTSIKNYVDKLEDGDTVTFMTFDTKVKTYPTILVDDENDKDILKKYISMIEAKGKWTFTIKMIKAVFKKAEEITKLEEDEEKKTVIVIMTDALDDPPPGKRRERFNMKSLASEYSGKDWWIYFVSFTELKKNQKIVDELKKELEKVAKKTKIIDATGQPEKGMQEVEKDHPADTGLPLWIIIGILIVAVLVIVLLVVKRGPGVVVTGTVEYWNTDILDPYIEKFDLGKHMTNEIVIGRGVNCHLKLHDIEIPGTFSIYADKNQPGLRIKTSPGVEFNFKNKDAGNILEDGDIFEVGNFGFKYNV
jgi:hypothetical protein